MFFNHNVYKHTRLIFGEKLSIC